MKKLLLYITIVFVSLGVFSCGDDQIKDLPTVEERVSKAKDSLITALTAPTFGWKINYQPNPSSGSFIILMKFEADGKVNIKSDVYDNDGEFLDATITYRIDNAHGLELILETYGVFHYFFEFYNGEFEFILLEYINNNPVFQSKTDFSNPTILNFEPAGENDAQLLNNEITKNFKNTMFQSEQLFGSNVYYQLYLIDKDISIFITLDLDLRSAKVLNAGVGETIEEINNNNNRAAISHKTNYTIQGDKVVFTSPVNFNLNGQSILISEFELSNFQELTDSFCDGQTLNIGKFDGKIGNENITFTSTLYSSGTNFTPISDGSYNVSSIGMFDDQDETLQEMITAIFPDVAGIQFYFKFPLSDGDFYGVGFIVVDSNNNADFFLREFAPPTFNGNQMNMTFTGQSLITREPTAAEEQGLIDLTDFIFGSGQVYILEFAGDDDAFELYNACNNHKLFLFK